MLMKTFLKSLKVDMDFHVKRHKSFIEKEAR